MKKTIVKIISLIILAALAAGMVACASTTVYDSLSEDGFDVRVRFDSDGAFINNTQNITVVEVYSSSDAVTVGGKTGISILAPDDPRREKESTFSLAKTDGKNNYVLAGWYTERTLRTDANGNALDAYGMPISESGREQAYVYGGRWDFDKDLIDPDSLENGEMTLYAAWVPFFTYEFYSENENGEFEKLGSKNKLTLVLPQWNDRKGEYNMKDFPSLDGKTFAGAYLDPNFTDEISADLDGREYFIDYEKGIAIEVTVKVYIKWAE